MAFNKFIDLQGILQRGLSSSCLPANTRGVEVLENDMFVGSVYTDDLPEDYRTAKMQGQNDTSLNILDRRFGVGPCKTSIDEV